MNRKLLLWLFLFSSYVCTYSQVAITEVYFDTPYSEASPRQTNYPHHLGEFIELYNYSTESITLDGWCLTDYVSRYDFPLGTVIPSNGFLVVAYRHNTDANYFTSYFPSTQGQEAKILYQDQIMLRNKREHVKLRIGKLKGHDFGGVPEVSSVIWNIPEPQTNEAQGYEDPANVNYYINSYHFQGFSATYEDTASPLGADAVPATIPLEDNPILNHVYTNAYDNLTWKYYADLLLNMACPLSITNISQNPAGNYLEQGRCFNYDISGNNTSSTECLVEDDGGDDDGGQNPPTEYTAAEVEEIDSKIILYPVPTPSVLYITWDATVNGKINEIQICNTAGVPVGDQNISPSQGSAQFNIGSHPAGVYIVKIILNTGQIISRNIIKN